MAEWDKFIATHGPNGMCTEAVALAERQAYRFAKAIEKASNI